MRSPVLAISAAVLLAFSLSGCITIQLPGAPVVQDDNANDSVLLSCDEEESITDAGSYDLQGDCPSVTIEGVDIHVTADTIVELYVSGDRNEVEVDKLSDLVINGTVNEVEFPSASSVDIAGDRNAIEADEGIGTLAINGNDNDITVGTEIGSVSDSGERNRIGH